MKRRPAHTPPVLAPTAYGCAAAVLGAVLYLVAVQTGSDACMAGALAILLSHIVSLGVALSAFLDEKWRGKAEHTHRAARMVHRIAHAAADRSERVTYDRIDQMDVLSLPDIRSAIRNKTPIILRDETKGIEMEVVPMMTDRERAMVVEGGLLNYTKSLSK